MASLRGVRAVVKGSQGTGSACYNVFNWAVWNGADTEISDIMDAIVVFCSTFFNHVRDYLPYATLWTVVEILYQTTTSPEWVSAGERALSLAGNDSAEALPSGVAPVLTGLTGVPRTRGRKFLPALSERASSAQTWVFGALLKLVACGGLYLATLDWGTEGALWPIAYDAVNDLLHSINSVRINAIPGYQRRRKPGVGL